MPSLVGSVPPRFRDRTLDGFDPKTASQRSALEAARRLVEGSIANLVLAGKPGVGKTHLAAGIVRAVRERLRADYLASIDPLAARYPEIPADPSWINVADAVQSMRLEMDAPLDDRDATLALRSARTYRGLVVLDDLGREKVSDWTGETIYALVNARYESKLPTLVTTNLTGAELAASPYWPAISRLAEDGELVKIDAPDWRLRR